METKGTGMAQRMRDNRQVVEWLKKHPEAMDEIKSKALRGGMTA